MVTENLVEIKIYAYWKLIKYFVDAKIFFEFMNFLKTNRGFVTTTEKVGTT